MGNLFFFLLSFEWVAYTILSSHTEYLIYYSTFQGCLYLARDLGNYIYRENSNIGHSYHRELQKPRKFCHGHMHT